MHSCMAVSCTNMPEAQSDYCVAYHVLVHMLVVHVTQRTCDAANGHEGTLELRNHSELL